MFDKYSQKARRAIFFARWEAGKLKASEIKPEHLLLALIREDGKLFKCCKKAICADVVGDRLKDQMAWNNKKFGGNHYEIEVSNGLNQLFGYAIEESEKLRSSYIGTQHLLLALLRLKDPLIEEILADYEISFDAVLQELNKNPIQDYEQQIPRCLLEENQTNLYRADFILIVVVGCLVFLA